MQGHATVVGSRFSISGAGTDIWGTADQFTFVYQRLDGDGVVIARVSSPAPTDAWAKAGVMIRESLAADSKYAFVLTSPRNGRAFQRRRVSGGASVHTPGGGGRDPVWVMLERRASTLRAYLSENGTSWTPIGTDVITMSQTVYAGIAVTSRNGVVATTADMTNVSVTPLEAVAPASLPAGWLSQGIGTPLLLPGSADNSGGTFTVTGAGADIAGLNDHFRYAYRQIVGDIEIIARVTAVESVNAGSKAGVMLRDALTPNAAHASMLVSAGNGILFQQRPLAGGPSLPLPAGGSATPYWVRLERRLDVVTAYHSSDGVNWIPAGVTAMPLPTMYVGLAVTSNSILSAATALFDNVIVRPPLPLNLLPSISLTSPLNNALFEDEVAIIPLSANATDTDGTVNRVDFYANGILLGSDTTSPFSYTWNDPADGTYALSAVATDDDGATTTSDPVTVQRVRNRRPVTALTSPANGATFTAPAAVTIAATASDPDGTVARVDFFAGTTQIGSDTTSPYGMTWSNVPAGTYSLTSVAVDNRGKSGTSTTRTISVTASGNQPPTAALSAPANGATYTAPATVTITATASDTDGTVASVSFYADTTLIDTDTTSPYSMTWSNVAAGTYSLTAVARDNAGATTTSAARSITVNGTSLPAGWTGADIGQPPTAGSAAHNAGTFTVRGAGELAASTDQFRYVYRSFSGDVDIVSRVATLEAVQTWTKAGVMIREALTANSAYASMLVSAGGGNVFHRRLATGGARTSSSGSAAGAPYWVRLERRGSVVTAFESDDGTTWATVGTMSLAQPNMYVGLAVMSGDGSVAATAELDNVVVQSVAPLNQPPTVALTAPANGASFAAPATVTVSASASDADGTIASVSFFANGTAIGTATTSPYSVTWSNVPAGSYSLTAVARDDDGATTTSAARSISVGAPPPAQHRAAFAPASNHGSAVDRYVLNIYTAGANPDTATPVATRDLGKPPVSNGECNVDVSQTVQGLPPGSYIATVTAVGPGGSARSTPSPAFTR